VTAGEHRDAVVVGAGFGGSIAALRLAEAGRSVLVLERGRRWAPEDFPRDVRDTDTLLWRYPRRRSSTGLYDVRFFSGLGALVASGVGGGSLVYADIHVRPDAVAFDDPRWPEGTDRAALEPYYDRVAERLALAPLPVDVPILKRDVFRAAAADAGFDVFDPDQAVRWRDCRYVAECEFGCRHGAKSSMDVTYLAAAQRLGAEVRTHALVRAVEPCAQGYRVHYERVPGGERAAVTASRLVLCAGTLGTTELLLRCRDVFRTLPRVSSRLGFGYSANGDFLGSIQGAEVATEPSHGPDVTSVVKRFDAAPHLTMAAPTYNRGFQDVLTSLGQPSGRLLRPLAPALWPLLAAAIPWALRRGLLSRPLRVPFARRRDPSRTTFLFAIGRDDAGGRMHLRRGRLDVAWDYAARHGALVDRMVETMAAVADRYGGTFAPLVTWNGFGRIATVHSLGGCAMAATPAAGVVSPHGEVHGHPGLYVADGSVVPAAIGFHPVMTICALAERTAGAVVESW
jgi:cholesterol oxidase